MRRWIVLALVGVITVVVTALITAPARFLDKALERATLGRVRLAEAAGTIWQGSGRLVFVDVSGAGEPGLTSAGVAVPGRLTWSVRPLPLLFGLVDATVSTDGMAAPVRLQGSFTELRIGPGSLSLPSVELGRLGSPWNSVRPSGALAVQWQTLLVRQGQLTGQASIELRDMASAMTPVRPLGSYRIDIDGKGARADLAIETLSGPLLLSGNGTWDARGGLRFVAQASAEPAEAARLQSFLGLLGRREGDHTTIKIGA